MLSIKLSRVHDVLGIYGDRGDVFPARMAFLHPDAAVAFAAMEKTSGKRIRVSDMFRTANDSLVARAQKQGVQPPGYSAHNFGLAIDVATDACLDTFRMNKVAFDKFMEGFGWYCHRPDGKRGFEDWHFNYLGQNAAKYLAISGKRTRDSAIEARIKELYAPDLILTTEEAQTALAKLKMYGGKIDGKWGAASTQAMLTFQRAWGLKPTGAMDEKSDRTLAYVTAEIQEVEYAA